MKSIFEYKDHLKCLKDIYLSAKKIKANTVSHGTISQRLGYKSRGAWGHILKGAVKLKPDQVKVITDFFNLHEQEAKYIDLLVKHNQATREKRFKYKKLLSQFNKENKRFIDDEKHHFYEDWLNTVIRNLCSCDDFKKNDYAKINSHLIKFRFPEERIKKAVKYLLNHDYIFEDSSGYLKATDGFVVNNTQKGLETLNKFHIEMMNFAKKSVTETPKKERQISSLNVSVSKTGYNLILDTLQECRSKIKSIIEDETDCEQVYQINLQIFPMTNIPNR